MIGAFIHFAIQVYVLDLPNDMVQRYAHYIENQEVQEKISRSIVEEVKVFTPQPQISKGNNSETYNPYDGQSLHLFADEYYEDANFDELLPGDNQDTERATDNNAGNDGTSVATLAYEDELHSSPKSSPSTTSNTNTISTNSMPQNGAVLGDRVVSPEDYHPPTKVDSPASNTSDSSSGNVASIQNAPNNNFVLHIAKIGLTNVPITPTNINDENIWFDDLKNGVGNYLSTPGKGHKVGIFGHSSNYSWVKSDYNYVFKDLNLLEAGDIIFVDYDGKRYPYIVSKKEITGKYVPSVITDYGREELVMFTCWPLLTSKNRLIVYAEPLF